MIRDSGFFAGLLAFQILAGSAFAFNVADFNPVWTSQSTDVSGSMPIGNGETTCNVWLQNNSIYMLIARTDAWNEGGESRWWRLDMLPKLAKVEIKFTPSIFSTNFSQVLKLDQGAIEISGGTGVEAKKVRIWVDANASVIRIESSGPKKTAMSVSLDKGWGSTSTPKTYETADSMLVFYHRNPATSALWNLLATTQGVNKNNYPNPLANRTFGGMIAMAKGVVSGSTITSPSDTSTLCEIFTHTSLPATVAGWISETKAVIAETHATTLAKASAAHLAWWKEFWGRSWISLDNSRKEITTNYLQQRFVSACQGRGNYPIKFNGGLFNFGDDRSWGGPYWMQNTRLIFWPLLATGDFDLLHPFFKMYTDMLPIRLEQSKAQYGHGGMHIPETVHFFGLWDSTDYQSPTNISGFVGPHYNGTLEFLTIMLEYFKYTGDTQFVKSKLIPYATEALRFFDLHFKRVNGKIELSGNALESFWKVKNPSCDVAGLIWNLDRLLELPSSLVPDTLRTTWTRLRTEIPPLPMITEANVTRLNYYTGSTGIRTSEECPELYSIFPYRLYGIDKPDMTVGITSYMLRANNCPRDWCQSAIWAAYLGLADTAWSKVYNALKNGQKPFTAFWDGIDGMPQQNSGNVGMMGLQTMLLQAEGDTIRLFPAWKKSWNVDFRLHAPGNTVVEGTLVSGVLTRLAVGPVSRKSTIKLLNGVTFNMNNVIPLDDGTMVAYQSIRNELSVRETMKISIVNTEARVQFQSKPLRVELFDMSGKQLRVFDHLDGNQLRIAMKGLPRGCYTIRGHYKKGFAIGRIVWSQ